jgi:uroporphyrinogen-III synthase
MGAEPVEVPLLEIQPPADWAPLDRALGALGSYDWLILTSANAVRALKERAIALGRPFELNLGPKVAAVGEATAAAARLAGLPVNLVPEHYVAESLIEQIFSAAHKALGRDLSDSEKTSSYFTLALHTHPLEGHDLSASQKSGALAHEGSLRGLRFLLARAEMARDVIPDALRAAGATVDVVDAYRNVMPQAAPQLLRQALAAGIDAATFTSSSSVTHLASAAREAGIAFPLAGVRAISIGPITSQTLRDLGWEPAAEASVSDISGLVAAIVRSLNEA